MWEASAPLTSATQTAKACADGVRDSDTARRLLNAASELESNSNRLRAAARGHTLNTVTAVNYKVRGMTDDEMKSLYNGQLGRSDRRAAKKIRSELISSGPYGLCCYCRHGEATTLDHFVPKDRVPALSIDPWNLVPACSRCNHKLLSYLSGLPDEQFFHPYAMPPMGRWLRAVVVPGEPVSVLFYASPDPGLHASIQNRIVNEFTMLGLAALFSIVSGPDISEMDAVLSRQFPPKNGGIVQAHLYDAATAALASDDNNRRGALFEALASDHVYCNGGYLVTAPITI